jgi:hypothetical protein
MHRTIQFRIFLYRLYFTYPPLLGCETFQLLKQGNVISCTLNAMVTPSPTFGFLEFPLYETSWLYHHISVHNSLICETKEVDRVKVGMAMDSETLYIVPYNLFLYHLNFLHFFGGMKF